MIRRLAVGLSVTALAVIGAGTVAWKVTSADIPDELVVGDRVQAAIDEFQTSHVYVAPDGAGLLTAEQQVRIDQAAAAADPEVFVVAWTSSAEAGYYLEREALDQIGAELDRPGLYLVVSPDGYSQVDIGIAGDYLSIGSSLETTGGMTPAELTDGLLAVIAENDGRDYTKADTTGSDYWGGTGSMIAAGVLLGVVAGLGLAVVLVAVWFAARRMRRPA